MRRFYNELRARRQIAPIGSSDYHFFKALGGSTTISLIKKPDSYSLRQMGTSVSFTTADTPGSPHVLKSNFAALENEWFHVAMVYEPTTPTTGEKRLYINGQLDASEPRANSPRIAQGLISSRIVVVSRQCHIALLVHLIVGREVRFLLLIAPRH